jgi:hypothetical protein
MMYSKANLVITILAVATTITKVHPGNPHRSEEVVRGWLSDDGCARGRAQNGMFTATNGECAKRCVSEGKKIVLIDPQGQRILSISNQDIVKQNIGDYVELAGTVEKAGDTMQVVTLKFLDKNRAICAVPTKKAGEQKPE